MEYAYMSEKERSAQRLSLIRKMQNTMGSNTRPRSGGKEHSMSLGRSLTSPPAAPVSFESKETNYCTTFASFTVCVLLKAHTLQGTYSYSACCIVRAGIPESNNYFGR